MEKQIEEKRFFFAFDVFAPWPEKLPPAGRIIEEENRHLTLVFLGNVNESHINENLYHIPTVPFSVGKCGFFNKCLFLPNKHANVAAWQVHWLDNERTIENFQKQLSQYLQEKKLIEKKNKHFLERDFHAHVSIARKPKNLRLWKESFIPLPMYIQNLHLFESLGYSKYHSLWKHKLIPPFEEIPHTADIAFYIYGESLSQIHLHAQTALAFKFPQIVPYYSAKAEKKKIDDVIIELNKMVTKMDMDIGSPIKAVSFHGEVVCIEKNIYKWEMVIDV